MNKYNFKNRFLKSIKKAFTRSIDNGININELYGFQKEGAIIVDVRSNQEFKENHISGAINLPLFELNQNTISKYIKNKNDTIILYCKSGGRSQKAYKIFYELGYKNLYQLQGGLDSI